MDVLKQIQHVRFNIKHTPLEFITNFEIENIHLVDEMVLFKN